ncbi:MAG: kelch repeat-containing protein [Myxococcales bacterium]|nr:kelch motif-containing protein [Polyangiaceae bacterium]MDW8249993.1 kelch repeat-containing protein [Myxococcales bacterium]
MKKRFGVGSVRWGLLGVTWLAATVHGCAVQEDEGDYINPPLFNDQQTQQVVLGAHTFLRDEGHQLRTATSYGRLLRARITGQPPEATRDIPELRNKLEAVFHGDYADGLTVSAATHPNASLRVVPVRGQHSSPRLRKDGTIVAFEEAFPNVTSAYGGNDSKLEEFLLIPSAKDIPDLAYDLHPGPDFDHFEEEDGRLWAYARDGAGLFTIEPPVAEDATGRRVTGSWKLTEHGRGYRITVQIELQGLTFPVLLDPTFETPLWFRNSTGQPSARAGAAGAFDPETGCSLVFGGATSSSFDLAQDLAVRCADRQWKSGLTAATMPPERAYGAMAYFGGSTKKVFLFGGFGASGALKDLWRANLTCTTPGVSSTCSVTWTEIPVPTNGPARRYLHGMAWNGNRLMVFGGIAHTGAGLRDTWEYDADNNTWTRACIDCFGGAKGNYGFATTTLVHGSSRTVYVSGGYDDPQNSNGNFLNTIARWTGSSWVNVFTANATIPMNAFGAIQAGSPFFMQPRYLHWMAPTSSRRLLMGSGLMISGGTNIYYEDTWVWNDRSLEGESDQWTRGVVPTSVANAPGRRESATAIFDENLKEIVLFGGLTSTSSVASNARVYRGVERDFTFTQSCTTSSCSKIELRVTFPGLNETTTPKCSDMQASYSARNVANSYVIISSFGNASFDGSTCHRSFITNRIPSTYIDYVTRVRDKRYHEAAIECSTNASQQEVVGGKPICLSNGGEGYASCGGLVSPSTPSLNCTKF